MNTVSDCFGLKKMDKPTILFVPSKYNHWLIYLPLLDTLKNAGVNMEFVFLKGFFDVENKPDEDVIRNIKTWTPDISIEKIPRYKINKINFSERYLLPQWKKYLQTIKKGILVIAQDGGAIQRLILREAKKIGIKSVAIQDGFFVSLPGKFGWSLESKKKRFIKQILSYTSSEKYLHKAFGAISDYWGLYGFAVKDRLVQNCHSKFTEARVIGSPRHAFFKEKVKSTIIEKDSQQFKIVCLPSTFPMYGDKQLYTSQDESLKWLVENCLNIRNNKGLDIIIDLKVKRGYDNQIKLYNRLLDNSIVTIKSGETNIVRLIAEADLVVTTGSTAALEAAVCNKPVIQIMHPYLAKRLTLISGLPTANSKEEVYHLIENVIKSGAEFCTTYSSKVSNEIADIDHDWDSIKMTSNWLLEILNE